MFVGSSLDWMSWLRYHRRLQKNSQFELIYRPVERWLVPRQQRIPTKGGGVSAQTWIIPEWTPNEPFLHALFKREWWFARNKSNSNWTINQVHRQSSLSTTTTHGYLNQMLISDWREGILRLWQPRQYASYCNCKYRLFLVNDNSNAALQCVETT